MFGNSAHYDWLVDGQPAQEAYSGLGYSASSPLGVGSGFLSDGSVLTQVGEMAVMPKNAFAESTGKVTRGEEGRFHITLLDEISSPN